MHLGKSPPTWQSIINSYKKPIDRADQELQILHLNVQKILQKNFKRISYKQQLLQNLSDQNKTTHIWISV